MANPILLIRLIVAALVAVGTFAMPPMAAACSLPKFEDNGRYVGGDLATQIASGADTIQIVRVSARHIVRRTYSEGEWYFHHGDRSAPSHQPEFIDEFVFELLVIETLKSDTPPRAELYENRLRILAYSMADLLASSHQDASDNRPHPNRLPDWLLDRPGNDGYAFTGGAAQGVSLSLGECNSPYLLDVGQTFVALRDSMGRLYPAEGAFPLRIEAEFRARRRARITFNMQSLIPIDGDDDAFLARLRQALADLSER